MTNRGVLADLHRWASSKNFAANLQTFVGLTSKIRNSTASIVSAETEAGIFRSCKGQ